MWAKISERVATLAVVALSVIVGAAVLYFFVGVIFGTGVTL